MILINVVFPAPLGPNNPNTEPFGTSILTLFNALKDPNDLDTLLEDLLSGNGSDLAKQLETLYRFI